MWTSSRWSSPTKSVAPYPVEQLLAREDAAGIASQGGKQAEFDHGEGDRVVVHGHLMTLGVYDEARRPMRPRRCPGAPQQRLDSSDKLSGENGFTR